MLSSVIFALMRLFSLLGSGVPSWQTLLPLCSQSAFGIALVVGFIRLENSFCFAWALHFGDNAVFTAQTLLFHIDHRGPAWWIGFAEWAP